MGKTNKTTESGKNSDKNAQNPEAGNEIQKTETITPETSNEIQKTETSNEIQKTETITPEPSNEIQKTETITPETSNEIQKTETITPEPSNEIQKTETINPENELKKDKIKPAVVSDPEEKKGTIVTPDILKRFPALGISGVKVGDHVLLPGDEVAPASESELAKLKEEIDRKNAAANGNTTQIEEVILQKEKTFAECVSDITEPIRHRNEETNLPPFSEKEISDFVKKSVGAGVTVNFEYPNGIDKSNFFSEGKIIFKKFDESITWPANKEENGKTIVCTTRIANF